MGYTHYWHKKDESNKQNYSKAIEHIRDIVFYSAAILGNYNGDIGSVPEIYNDKYIKFNGIGDQSCETFYLPLNLDDLKDFDFCKTRRREYDQVVVACLTVLKHFCPNMYISSDGENEDLEDGLKLAIEVTGIKHLVNFGELITEGEE